MKKFQATFANGAIMKRSSEREYKAAWYVTYTAPTRVEPTHSGERGFSSSMLLAMKASDSIISRFKKRDALMGYTGRTYQAHLAECKEVTK